jgi:Secretion system C-terminal sorting domain
MATTKHVNLFTNAPQGTFTTNWMPAYQSETVDKSLIWLQLILNLRRKDGKGANVLLVVTYPTKFVDAGTACKNCFEQVSQPEIHKFCTDVKSIYRENRVLAKEKSVETAMQPTIQRFKAFPNPVDNLLHIHFDSETEQTVKAWLTDVTGRVVSDILEQKTGKGNYNLDLPTQDLPEGLHLFVFEVNGIKKVQKVVIRH